MLLSFVPVFDLTALLPKASAAETDEDLSAAPCNVANRAYMDGVYIIHSAADPDLVLDIAGNTTGNGDAAFELDLADGSDTQRFVFQLDEKITGSKVYGLRAITSKRWMTKQSDSTVSLNFWGQQTIETSGINTIQQFVIQKSDGGFYDNGTVVFMDYTDCQFLPAPDNDWDDGANYNNLCCDVSSESNRMFHS